MSGSVWPGIGFGSLSGSGPAASGVAALDICRRAARSQPSRQCVAGVKMPGRLFWDYLNSGIDPKIWRKKFKLGYVVVKRGGRSDLTSSLL